MRFGCVQSEDEDEFAYNDPSPLMATELGQQRKSSMPLRKTKVYACTSNGGLPIYTCMHAKINYSDILDTKCTLHIHRTLYMYIYTCSIYMYMYTQYTSIQ